MPLPMYAIVSVIPGSYLGALAGWWSLDVANMINCGLLLACALDLIFRLQDPAGWIAVLLITAALALKPCATLAGWL